MRWTPVPRLLTGALTALALVPAAAAGQAVAPEPAPSAQTVTAPAPEPSEQPATAPAPAPGPAPAEQPGAAPAPGGGLPPAAPAEPRRRTVLAQLAALRDAGGLTPAAHDRARVRYRAARATRTRLTGRRRAELSSVLRTLEAVTRRGELTSTRVPLAFETLERNRQWWSAGALLGYGARVGFPGSELVWQSYPGQGIQVQWLGTWGKANALWTGRTFDARLRALVDEARALAAVRAGGIAWESWFSFDGGRPPWVSALSQGTALQALSRASLRLRDPALLTAARAALGIFRSPPPVGVRLATPAGAHYLQYSFAPGLRIVNGFVQSLNGLHDFGALANDAEGRQLLAAGTAQLAVELPRADTGAWSRYAVGGRESDLGYHRLLRDVLRGLCARTREALPCRTAARFTRDLTRAPVLRLLGPAAPLRHRSPGRLAFRLDKVSSVAVVVTRGRQLVLARTARFARGRHTFALPRLRRPGALTVRLRAVDPAGNVGTTAGRVDVGPAPARSPGAS